jgi:hypothetical protein
MSAALAQFELGTLRRLDARTGNAARASPTGRVGSLRSGGSRGQRPAHIMAIGMVRWPSWKSALDYDLTYDMKWHTSCCRR